MVRCYNISGEYGEVIEEGYYKKIFKVFLYLRLLFGKSGVFIIKLDGVNGVGVVKIKEMVKYLRDFLFIWVCNDGFIGKFNEKCGVDYVKFYQCVFDGMVIIFGDRCVIFDGDVDRVLYFYFDKENKFYLFDGDKIVIFMVGYLKEKFDKIGVVFERGLGIVQIVYVNGSLTLYVKNIFGVFVVCVKIGVKYVYYKAEEFDIGVYFEVNGYGIALFINNVINKMKVVM